MKARAVKDFKANDFDVRKGDMFKIEDEGVMVNNQFMCTVGSPNFESYFELIED